MRVLVSLARVCAPRALTHPIGSAGCVFPRTSMSLQVSALRAPHAQRLAIPTLAAGLTSRAMFLALVVVALPLIVHANRPLEGDVWWALAFGRDLVAHGALPTSDPFTFSPHAPQFIDAQWLTQLVF